MKVMINERERVLEGVDPDMPLLWAIRDMVGLTGTKFGSGQALRGSCTVHVDGKPVRSCSFEGGAMPCIRHVPVSVDTGKGLPGTSRMRGSYMITTRR